MSIIKNLKMKSVFSIGLIISTTLLLTSCSKKNNSDTTTSDNSPEKIFPVKVQKVIKKTVPQTLEYTADLSAFKEIHYAPASPGRIHTIHVEVNDRVKKGQLLLEMDKTQYIQSLSQLENAEYNFKSIDTLYQLGSISEQQYQQVKTQYELAQANYTFLKNNTSLVSPIDGIVTGKYFENGELFLSAPNTSAGKAAVISLMQIKALKAIVSISQSHFPFIKEGMQVNIKTDIYPDKTFKGTVYKIYPTIDASTRTFKTEILVDNQQEILRPGMFAQFELILKNIQAIVIPSIAILKEDGTNKRFIYINNNGVAKQIEVKIGKRFDDMVELLTNDLKEDDELIIEGQINLMNGSKIKILN